MIGQSAGEDCDQFGEQDEAALTRFDAFLLQLFVQRIDDGRNLRLEQTNGTERDGGRKWTNGESSLFNTVATVDIWRIFTGFSRIFNGYSMVI